VFLGHAVPNLKHHLILMPLRYEVLFGESCYVARHFDVHSGFHELRGTPTTPSSKAVPIRATAAVPTTAVARSACEQLWLFWNWPAALHEQPQLQQFSPMRAPSQPHRDQCMALAQLELRQATVSIRHHLCCDRHLRYSR
jgi:hypothetical protein